MIDSQQSKKIGRLDNAFLFILSSVGLVISFIQITIRDLNGAIEAIPFLLLGTFLPFYIGYMRGAIEIDSSEERMRGWIYLIIGTISYFASFVFGIVEAEYIFKQFLFLSLIACSLFITYLLLRWSKKVFNITGTSHQYAFSGTTLCVVITAFLIRLLVSLYFDLQGKNITEILLTNPTELLFWLSIVIASISIVLVFEKASRNALQTTLKLPESKGDLGRIRAFLITRIFFIKGLALGSMLFEYALNLNQKVFVLWTQAFAFWGLGCILWMARVPLVPSIFFLIAVIYSSLGGVIFYKMPAITFENIEDTTTINSAFVLLLSVSILTMLLFSIQVGMLLLACSAALYLLSYIRS